MPSKTRIDWPVLITWVIAIAVGLGFWWLMYRLFSGLAALIITLP